MKFLRWLLPRWLQPKEDLDAVIARIEAERKLKRAKKDWPKVQEAHQDLSSWVNEAFRRGGLE